VRFQTRAGGSREAGWSPSTARIEWVGARSYQAEIFLVSASAPLLAGDT